MFILLILIGVIVDTDVCAGGGLLFVCRVMVVIFLREGSFLEVAVLVPGENISVVGCILQVLLSVMVLDWNVVWVLYIHY